MMEDWDNDDKNLLAWRAATGDTVLTFWNFRAKYYDNGVLMVAMVRQELNWL
jgi:ketol-acid reductoisomerase